MKVVNKNEIKKNPQQEQQHTHNCLLPTAIRSLTPNFLLSSLSSVLLLYSLFYIIIHFFAAAIAAAPLRRQFLHYEECSLLHYQREIKGTVTERINNFLFRTGHTALQEKERASRIYTFE